MYKAILAFVLFFGSVLPALCEDGSLFLIYSYSPNDRSARSRPIKKVRSAKSRTMNTGWGYNKPDESFDWEVPSIALRSVTANKFMFSNGGVGYGKSVIQTDLNVSFKSGIYFDLWNSLPFKKNKEELGTELDYNMGWTGSKPSEQCDGIDWLETKLHRAEARAHSPEGKHETIGTFINH